MQKFTRPLTREIELAGERLAVTFNEQGLSVRPVGSRRPPREMSWEALLYQLVNPPGTGQPGPEQVAQAVHALRTSAPTPPPAKPAPAPEPQGGASQVTRQPSDPAAGGDVAALFARLQKWLAAHRRRFLEGLRPGASSEELHALEKQLGRPLPADLRTLLAWHNGQGEDLAGCFVESWNLMGTKEIAAAKQELDAAKEAGWQAAWIPFLDDDAGDYLCVDASAPEAAVRKYVPDKGEHPVVAPSLRAWLERFVTDLERGAYEEDPERGHLLRKSS